MNKTIAKIKINNLRNKAKRMSQEERNRRGLMTCPWCEGTGRWTYNSKVKKYTCPKCYGLGYIVKVEVE